MSEIERDKAPLARARQRAGLGQYEAAKVLKVSTEHLSRVERGQSGMSEALAARMSEAYGTTPKQIWRLHTMARRVQARATLRHGGRRGGRAA